MSLFSLESDLFIRYSSCTFFYPPENVKNADAPILNATYSATVLQYSLIHPGTMAVMI